MAQPKSDPECCCITRAAGPATRVCLLAYHHLHIRDGKGSYRAVPNPERPGPAPKGEPK